MQFWQDLEGETFGGVYRIKKYVHGDESSALFTTETNRGNPNAYDLRVFRTESESEEHLLNRLETARQLSHPNLVRIFDVDSAEVGSDRVVYAAAEHTEENLRDALRERALTEGETREVVRSIGSALRAIHGKQLVHGNVQPLNIFATAETIKLRGDCIVPAGTPADSMDLHDAHLAPEVPETGLTPAADIWSLGILICDAFNQHRPNLETPNLESPKLESPSPESPSPESPNVESKDDLERVPEPFAEIAKHCLAVNPAERWKLEEITIALGAAGVSKPRQPAPTQPQIHTPAPEPTPIPGPAPVIAPVPAGKKTKPAEAAEFGSAYPRRRPLPAKHRSIPASLYAGGVVFALLLAAWLLFRPRAPKPVASSVPPVTTAEQHVANPEPATPAGGQGLANGSDQSRDNTDRKESPMRGHETITSGKRAAAPTISTPPNASASAKAPGAKEDRPVWRVIAYTYGKAEDAQRRVDQIKSKHPELGPEVFSAEPDHGPYLVVLGGQMDKAEATRLKRQAVSAGMPRDTYAQNYSR